jgi:hypothetical protein
MANRRFNKIRQVHTDQNKRTEDMNRPATLHLLTLHALGQLAEAPIDDVQILSSLLSRDCCEGYFIDVQILINMTGWLTRVLAVSGLLALLCVSTHARCQPPAMHKTWDAPSMPEDGTHSPASAHHVLLGAHCHLVQEVNSHRCMLLQAWKHAA